jgi:hypothetical protein
VPARNRVDRRNSGVALRQMGGALGLPLEPGVYLTDGAFLFRLVGSMAGGRDDVVELEDCYSLDVVRVSVKDLRERRLRLVTRDPSDGRGPSGSRGVAAHP